MQHYSSQAFTDIGKPAGGASIGVKLAGTNTNATIYSDDGVTVKSNPFVTNSLGQFDFYAASGKYDITISGTQITTYTLANQVVFDPFEVNAADTPVVAQALSVNLFPNGLTIPTGKVLAADQVLPLNVSGQGGFWGFIVNYPEVVTNGNLAAPAAGAPVANQVGVAQFFLPFKVQIGKVSYHITTGVAATTADIGIYDINGNKLAGSGGFSTAATGYFTASFIGAPITLNAGFYYFANTCSSTSPTAALVQTNVAGDPASIFVNGGSKVLGIAANLASGGVLPATLGVITSNALHVPICAYLER